MFEKPKQIMKLLRYSIDLNRYIEHDEKSNFIFNE